MNQLSQKISQMVSFTLSINLSMGSLGLKGRYVLLNQSVNEFSGYEGMLCFTQSIRRGVLWIWRDVMFYSINPLVNGLWAKRDSWGPNNQSIGQVISAGLGKGLVSLQRLSWSIYILVVRGVKLYSVNLGGNRSTCYANGELYSMDLFGNRSLCYTDINSTQSDNQGCVVIVITNELVKDTMVLLMGFDACTVFTQFFRSVYASQTSTGR